MEALNRNDWKDYTGIRNFKPVVTAFKEFLDAFKCKKCSWIYASPIKGSTDTLRCDCSEVNINLKKKICSAIEVM